MNILERLRKFFSHISGPSIHCVHGKKAFSRNLLAAELFQKELEDKGSGTVVCGPKAVVGILESLGVDLPDEMKYWNAKKKWEFAVEAVNNTFPNVFLASVAIDDDLMWIDGEALATGVVPRATIIFTGATKEDPFVKHDRTTYLAETKQKFKTEPNQFCSSWHRR